MAQSKSSPKQEPVARSFLKDYFPLIRKARVVFIASLLSGAALVGTGRVILTNQQDSLNQAQIQRGDAFNKRRQAETDQNKIHDYQPGFMALRERGFFGEERRLDWIEHIQHIRENRKLLPITYEISAQQVFQTGAALSIGDLELRGSKMKLHIPLLHEGDMLNFLADLKRKGFYTVQECTVKRADGVQENMQSPRLTAECTLYWLTLGEKSSNRDEASNPAGQ